MIFRKYKDYFVIKVFRDNIDCFNFFDINSIKDLFQTIFDKFSSKYKLKGLFDVDVYVNNEYGIIIEMVPIESYFDDIDMRIKMHLNNPFLVEIDSNSIIDFDDVYYYNDKFYGKYSNLCDSVVLYKNTDDIINNGIKVC